LKLKNTTKLTDQIETGTKSFAMLIGNVHRKPLYRLAKQGCPVDLAQLVIL